MAGSLDSPKWREWQRRMGRFRKTRQSVAEFCRKEGVSVPSFYQWRSRLAGPPRPAEATPGFRSVRVVGSVDIAVRLPGGTQLNLPTSDPEVLRLVIDRLAHADAQRAGGRPC